MHILNSVIQRGKSFIVAIPTVYYVNILKLYIKKQMWNYMSIYKWTDINYARQNSEFNLWIIF